MKKVNNLKLLQKMTKKEDTDEQPGLTDGDDEDNISHSMSLKKKK